MITCYFCKKLCLIIPLLICQTCDDVCYVKCICDIRWYLMLCRWYYNDIYDDIIMHVNDDDNGNAMLYLV